MPPKRPQQAADATASRFKTARFADQAHVGGGASPTAPVSRQQPISARIPDRQPGQEEHIRQLKAWSGLLHELEGPRSVLSDSDSPTSTMHQLIFRDGSAARIVQEHKEINQLMDVLLSLGDDIDTDTEHYKDPRYQAYADGLAACLGLAMSLLNALSVGSGTILKHDCMVVAKTIRTRFSTLALPRGRTAVIHGPALLLLFEENSKEWEPLADAVKTGMTEVKFETMAAPTQRKRADLGDHPIPTVKRLIVDIVTTIDRDIYQQDGTFICACETMSETLQDIRSFDPEHPL